MAYVSPQTVKYNPIKLHLPDGPGGSFLFHEEKKAEEHHFSLYNLFQTLQNAEETQNWLNFRPIWFNIVKVMIKTNFCPMSLENPTKCGLTAVNSTKDGINPNLVERAPNRVEPFGLTLIFKLHVHMYFCINRRFNIGPNGSPKFPEENVAEEHLYSL